MITAHHLTKEFPIIIRGKGFPGFLFVKEKSVFTAVKDLNLNIKDGEFVAFLGPNGAGKTTTLKMLSGVLHPTKGEISVNGYIPYERKLQFKKEISFVMAQKTQLFLELPVRDTFTFIGEIYQVPKNDYEKRISSMIERFDLGAKLDTLGRKLSLGQRMKCELVCALIYQPKVLFLDEPTIGLDVNSAKEVRAFLTEINKEFGVTILLTTHNMSDVEELCDHTIVINKGDKVFDGQTRELKQLFGDRREVEFILNEVNKLKEFLSAKKEVTFISAAKSSVRVSCARNAASSVVAEVMTHFHVEDINFFDTELADVVGKLYKQQ